jgi:hypothetical protein
MKAPFKIYIKSVGIYALLTMPALVFPLMYVISLFYVLLFGWFAWALFTIIYFFTDKYDIGFETKMAILIFSIPVAVAFSFQMLQVFLIEENVWSAGSFLLFPVAAVIAGWISLLLERKMMKKNSSNHSTALTQHIDMG